MSTGIPQARSIQLQEQGWMRRFTAMGRRLNEAVELYGQLGFETLLEPADLDEEDLSRAEGCEHCIVTTLARTIYTRSRRRVDADEYS
ncbi:MAG TPA: hypothetical protein VGT44_10520 [Ktedonobacteraceae bacterium]|nr:hypothetical protein [Ktedonobacteraceae bacterium]